MKQLLKRATIGGTLIFLTACGDTGGSSSVDTAGNYKSGSCGYQVVSDYNRVASRCNYTLTSSDRENCVSTAKSFQAKYPGINCQAEQTSTSSVNNSTFTVTNDYIQKVIDKMSY